MAGDENTRILGHAEGGVVHAATEVVDPLAGRVQDAKSSQGWLVKNFDESWHAAMWS